MGTLSKIAYGFSTPIKISFQTDQCFFPLEISSGSADGIMEIQVAVLGSEALKDQNGVLKTDRNVYWSYKINEDIVSPFNPRNSPLAYYFTARELGDAQYMTLILRDAYPSNLTADAVFVPASQNLEPPAVIFNLDKGYNLVGNPFQRQLCATEFKAGADAFWVFDSESSNPWTASQCLSPCEAGFFKAAGSASGISLTGDPVEQAACASAFADKTGWNLTAMPSYLNRNRILWGPIDFNLRSRRYQASDTDNLGKGYWIYLK